MRVHNLRIGFATNSSSTHSIIYVPTGKLAGISEDLDYTDEYFGWDNFTLTSREAKMEYVVSQLSNAFHNLNIPEYMQVAYFRDQFGPDVLPRSVDHQSVWSQPRAQRNGKKSLPEAWVEDLRTFIIDNPNMIILGGNDNSDGHPLLESFGLGGYDEATDEEVTTHEGVHSLSVSQGFGYSYSRREAPGLWTFFNPKTGEKITMDLDPTRTERPRSIAPELVDIKITDYCPFGCTFCYQGSTQAGKHASYSSWGSDKPNLYSILTGCAEKGVFEIAYGGGEPTLHPEFLDILRTTANLGMVPSFTTKNLAWFRQDEVVREALEYVGGIAFSVDNAAQIEAYGRISAKYGGNQPSSPNRFTIHIVMGLQSLDTLKDMLITAHKHRLHVTLLGYKTTGRGNEVTPESYDGWAALVTDLIEERKSPSISVDTALAATHANELAAQDFPSWLYYTSEGQHSAYIDAVAGTVGMSSYAPKETMIPLEPRNFDVLWNQILEVAEESPLP